VRKMMRSRSRSRELTTRVRIPYPRGVRSR
jgi:hypothetical protein